MGVSSLTVQPSIAMMAFNRSEPKRLFVLVPVFFVSANSKAEQAKLTKEMFGVQGPYCCPVYKYPTRTDRFYVFSFNLKCTVEKNPAHWALRGAALLCNTD